MANRANRSTTKTIKLTVLGCGTSSGVPLIQCGCSVCKSKEPRNSRLRASVWIEHDGRSILIDSSTDLRQQALRYKIPRVDAVLYTHPHADHIHGIDELRAYNFIQKKPIPVFGNAWTCGELKHKFPYIFNPLPAHQHLGGGIPQLTLHQFDAASQTLPVLGLDFIPIPLAHGRDETVGFRLDRIAYLTDCSYIPDSSLDRLRGLEVLVLDCLRVAPHGTHFNLDQAIQVIEDLRPKKVFLTHLSHDFDYRTWPKAVRKGMDLPAFRDASAKRWFQKTVKLAYDGLRISA